MNDLLICAKALGLDAEVRGTKQIVYVRLPHHPVSAGCQVPYDPRTNDAQAMELLKWLIDRTGYVIELWNSKDGSWNIDTQGNNGYQTWSGQTLNEAIIKAVVAMEDTHE